MPKVSTNISLDADLKRKAQELFADLGMDLTTAVTLFIKQSLREQSIPFRIAREKYNSETEAALKEFELMRSHPEKYKRYPSFKDAMNDVSTQNRH